MATKVSGSGVAGYLATQDRLRDLIGGSALPIALASQYSATRNAFAGLAGGETLTKFLSAQKAMNVAFGPALLRDFPALSAGAAIPAAWTDTMAAANASVGAATGLASFAGRALELESEQRRTLSLLSSSIPSAETLARISGFGSVAAASALKDSLAAASGAGTLSRSLSTLAKGMDASSATAWMPAVDRFAVWTGAASVRDDDTREGDDLDLREVLSFRVMDLAEMLPPGVVDYANAALEASYRLTIKVPDSIAHNLVQLVDKAAEHLIVDRVEFEKWVDRQDAEYNFRQKNGRTSASAQWCYIAILLGDGAVHPSDPETQRTVRDLARSRRRLQDFKHGNASDTRDVRSLAATLVSAMATLMRLDH